jgi:hypothetical protein
MNKRFRVWDFDNSKFLYFEGIFNTKPWIEISSFPQYESYPKEINISKPTQFTGCQDKFKKDIYEDDYFQDQHGNLYDVIFWSGGFWLNPIPREKESIFVGYELDLVHSQNVLGQIVGNKYTGLILLDEGAKN